MFTVVILYNGNMGDFNFLLFVSEEIAFLNEGKN